jgi:transcription elongation GreA/GreB family factor
MLHARIGQIDSRIAELSMYTPASIPKDRAGYGSHVSVEDTQSGERVVYHLVFPRRGRSTERQGFSELADRPRVHQSPAG